MSGYFSMEGRYNRAKYFLSILVIGIIGYGLAFLVGLLLRESADLSTISAISWIIWLVIAVISAFPVVKRLHDLNRPGTHYWLLLIPLYNIYLAILLLFSPGTDGPNEYGSNPLAAKKEK
jgi:uncharacterized membrane protein YhaH (DUF805 family)